jgi:surface protein
MNNMFSHCKSLISIDLSNFNTENVEDMSYMFSDLQSLTL